MLRADGHIHGRYRAALVQCSCGTIDRVSFATLIRGASNHCASCGAAELWKRRHSGDVGERSGKRVILANTGSDKNKKRIITARCDCGTVEDISYRTFKDNNGCTQCARAGAKRTIEVTAGDRFGRRVVVKEDGMLGKHRAVLCRCDCGDLRRVSIHLLIRGKANSCGRWCGRK